MMIRGTALAMASLLAAAPTSAFAPNKPFLTKPSSTVVLSPLSAVPPGFKGGFKDSNPDYSYAPDLPDLSDLPITGNLDNIDKITRMQKIKWPQFSWQSIPGDESSRLYEMFASDISRIGYDDTGRIWSIICPQRGFTIPLIGTVMLEVTVTGVRGWVDENTQSACANLGVEGVIWIEPSDNPVVGAFGEFLDDFDLPFSKANAVRARGHAVGKPYEEFWPMVNGTDPTFFHPNFAQHWDEAYSVYNLQVEIGKQIMTGNKFVDDFGTMLIELFNDASGNILAEGQKVAWNVWPEEPELVDTDEWKGHADRWLHSITVEHGYPNNATTSERTYYDGTVFEPKMEIKEVLKIIKKFVENNKDTFEKFEKPGKLSIFKYIAEYMFEDKIHRIIKKKC